jgi:hypothetical protein
MNCVFCNNVLPDDSEYCQYCGKNIVKDTVKADEFVNRQYYRVPRRIAAWTFVGLIIVGLSGGNVYQYIINTDFQASISDLEEEVKANESLITQQSGVIKKNDELISSLVEDLEAYKGNSREDKDAQGASNAPISDYAKHCTTVSVEKLYSNPSYYNGKDVAVTAWNAYYGYMKPAKMENFYQIYLINDVTRFLGSDKLSDILDADEFSIFAYVYYTEYIEPYNTPYVDAIIFERNVSEKIDSRENKMTVFGKFSYNPAYNEGGYITDPKPYQIEVYEYYFNK